MSLRRIESRLVTLFVCLLFASSAGAVTFSDGNFAAANWSTTVLVATGTESGSATTVSSGGNCCAHRAIATDSSTFITARRVMVIDLSTSSTVDPSTLGGISSVDHFEDQKCASADGCTGAGQGWFPALEQSGVLYVAPGQSTGVQESWVAASRTGLVATDFEEVLVNSSGLTVATSHPDFSSSGGTLTFGYARANTSSTPRTGRIDNWSVVVHGAPVPTTTSSFSTIKARFGTGD
jgi:hypothetical protein